MLADLESAPMSQEAVDNARNRRAIAAAHKAGAEPPLPQAQEGVKPEGVENYCPFGCQASELTAQGYCRHIAGFTSNGKTYEPQIKRMLPMRDANRGIILDEAKRPVMTWNGDFFTDGANPQVIDPKVHKVVAAVHQGRVPVSSRVYMDDPPEIRQQVQDGDWSEEIAAMEKRKAEELRLAKIAKEEDQLKELERKARRLDAMKKIKEAEEAGITE